MKDIFDYKKNIEDEDLRKQKNDNEELIEYTNFMKRQEIEEIYHKNE